MSLRAALSRRFGSGAGRYGQILQTVMAFAIRAFGAAASFAFNLLIARHYGAAGTGSFALALSTATVVSTAALCGLDLILIRTVAGDLQMGEQAAARGAIRTVAKAVGLISIAMAIILTVVGVPLMLRQLGTDASHALLWLSALLVVPMAMMRIGVAAMRGMGRILLSQFIDGPLSMLLGLGVFGTMLLTGTTGDTSRLFLVFAATTALATSIGWAVSTRDARQWPAPEKVPLLPLLGQGWRISLTTLSMFVADWLVLMMINFNNSAVEVGQFRTALQITMLIQMIVVTFDSVAGPRIAAAHRVGNMAEILRNWRQSIVIMTVMAMPLLAAALIVPEWLLGLFGPEFVAAAPALRILALGQFGNVLTGPAGSILVMTGREVWSLRISWMALLLLPVLGLTLIPAFGIVGAALTVSIVIVARKLAACFVILRR